MSAIGTKLRRVEGGRIAFWCPGCNSAHQVTVDGSRGWSWNGDGDRPTISPSILVKCHRLERDEQGIWTGGWVRGPDGGLIEDVCHSFVTDGRIRFLGDCTHAFAGQAVDLPDWPR